MKKLYFLSGLPRSGSTVLAALLNQHPDVHATATSGLLEILTGMLKGWEGSSEKANIQATSKQEVHDVIKAVCDAKYKSVKEKVVLDKNRSWVKPKNISTIKTSLGYSPKIIATVRNVEDCVASMVRIAKPSETALFLRESPYVEHIKQSYVDLLEAHHWMKEHIHYVEYEQLNKNPVKTLREVEQFLELSPHTYDTDNIDATGLHEKDEEVWNIKGLHDVRK